MRLRWKETKNEFEHYFRAEIKADRYVQIDVLDEGSYGPGIYGKDFSLSSFSDDNLWGEFSTRAAASKWCYKMLKATGYGD